MITLENVVKSYPNGVGAINGISLHIDRGEFVFIVGDSGDQASAEGAGTNGRYDPRQWRAAEPYEET